MNLLRFYQIIKWLVTFVCGKARGFLNVESHHQLLCNYILDKNFEIDFLQTLNERNADREFKFLGL